MTMRRHLLVFGLLAGALALGGGIWLLWPKNEPFDRIGIWQETRTEKVRRWLGF